MTKPNQQLRRQKLELAIRSGLTTAYCALYEIYKEHLYAPDYASFPEYAKAVLGYEKAQAYRLVHYAAFLAESPNGDLAKHLTEGAFRPLSRLKAPDDKKAAAEKIIELVQANAPINEQVTEQIARAIKSPVTVPEKLIKIDSEQLTQITAGLAEKLSLAAENLKNSAASENPDASLTQMVETGGHMKEALKRVFGVADASKAESLLADYLGAADSGSYRTSDKTPASNDEPQQAVAALLPASPDIDAKGALRLIDEMDTSATEEVVQVGTKSPDVARREPFPPPVTPYETDLQQGKKPCALSHDLVRAGVKIESHAFRGLDFRIHVALVVTPGTSPLNKHCPVPPGFSAPKENPFTLETILAEERLPKLSEEIAFAVSYMTTNGDLNRLKPYDEEFLARAMSWLKDHPANDATAA